MRRRGRKATLLNLFGTRLSATRCTSSPHICGDSWAQRTLSLSLLPLSRARNQFILFSSFRHSFAHRVHSHTHLGPGRAHMCGWLPRCESRTSQATGISHTCIDLLLLFRVVIFSIFLYFYFGFVCAVVFALVVCLLRTAAVQICKFHPTTCMQIEYKVVKHSEGRVRTQAPRTRAPPSPRPG